MATLGHTSVSSLAVRSLMSLCLIKGRAPGGQLKACSTEKLQPYTSVKASVLVSSRIGDTMHL